MIMRRSELTTCEQQVMKILWDAKEPCTCQEVIEALRKMGYSYVDTTVYTFLTNLKKKGYVDVFRRGANFYYPVANEDIFRRSQLKQMVEFWYGGNWELMIAELENMK